MRKRFPELVLFTVCFVGVSFPVFGQSVTCPPAPSMFKASVASSVSFDPNTNLFTYQYTISSDPTSQQEIADFGVDFAPGLSNIMSPKGWTNTNFADRNTVHWKATAAAPLAPDQPDTGQVPPGLFQIKPGTSLGGFSFQSPNPAGPVNYYALGFVDLATADDERAVESIVDSCPSSIGGFFDLAITGSTQGPVQFLPVQIEIKPGGRPNAINPADQGVVPVAILSTSSFNAPSTVDAISVRFGPASAPPTDGGHVEDVNNDGLPDLVFQFPTPLTGVACGDTSETLTGKTVSGTSIQGSDSVVTVNCKKK
jgi:hypothetical protein